MTNLAAALKTEIARIARKEVRTEVESLKKAAAGHRSDIAALKKRAQAAERELRALGKTAKKEAPLEQEDGEEGLRRFSAKGFASQRQRLGLSAPACGLLLGVSSQSVYNWESGEARPRAKHMVALTAFRSLGKKAALERLAAIEAKP